VEDRLIEPREVPLGGLRALNVWRTLPHRELPTVGAWCFVDHFGPTAEHMNVLPHPHTGLQTVTWLVDGIIEHRDSLGSHQLIAPGELNLMTSGHGISHSEVSTEGTSVLHGAQLWIALPDGTRDTNPGFEHFAPQPVRGPGWEARVFLGSLLGAESPVATHTPLLGAEVMLATGKTLEIEVDDSFEHGVLLDVGVVDVDGTKLEPGDLAYAAPGARTLTVTAQEEARLLVLGGPPFGEPIVMWWNFIGRTHEEIVGFREEWQAQIEGGRQVDGRFGVVDIDMDSIPAPEMPNVRLKLRH